MVFAMTVLLSGCFGPAALETAYDNADWLIGKEVERRFCPEAPRRAAFERAIDGLLRWHRKYELPRYAATLRQLARSLDGGLTRAEFDGVANEVEEARRRLWKRLARPSVSLLASAETHELECMERSAAEGLEKATADAAKTTAALDRVKSLVSRLEDFTGSFSDVQTNALVTAWGMTPESLEADLAERRQSATAFLAIFEQQDPRARQRALEAVFGGRRRLAGDDAEATRRRGLDRIWTLVDLLTDEQRATLKSSAETLAEMLDGMAARRPG
jgi:hypothetical protein